MAELAKARSMQFYIILYKTTLQLGVRNLPKVFTRQRPDVGGESNRVSTIRKSDALPVSHRATNLITPVGVFLYNFVCCNFCRFLPGFTGFFHCPGKNTFCHVKNQPC